MMTFMTTSHCILILFFNLSNLFLNNGVELGLINIMLAVSIGKQEKPLNL